MTFVLCHCANRRLLDLGCLQRLRAAVLAAGETLVESADFCQAAVAGDEGLRDLLSGADVQLCGCHERALRALVARLLGRPRPDLRVVDLRDPASSLDLASLGLPAAPVPGPAAPPALPAAADAWFPLLDASRCVNCGRCLSFCLFGVYERDGEGQVRVQQPLHCKTDCPACARICPEVAIIFPKCSDPALNGAARTPEQLRGARVRLDPKDAFGGDLRAKLAARRAAAQPPLFRPGVFASHDVAAPPADEAGGPPP